ncbi:MAG: DUF1080 domain-containing protein, partial [Flavisolibacter sp.]
MQKLSFIFFALALYACNSSNNNTMSADNKSDTTGSGSEEGFTSLFDGKSTNGWHSYGRSSVGEAWKVVDGTLTIDTMVKKTNPSSGGDLLTNEEYDNFHLKLEWKISPKGNSGIIFYVNED